MSNLSENPFEMEKVLNQAPFDQKNDERLVKEGEAKLMGIYNSLKKLPGLVYAHKYSCKICGEDKFPGFCSVMDLSFTCIKCLAIRKFKESFEQKEPK